MGGWVGGWRSMPPCHWVNFTKYHCTIVEQFKFQKIKFEQPTPPPYCHYTLLQHRDIAKGAFSEYALAWTDSIALKPETLSFVEAAAVPLTGITTTHPPPINPTTHHHHCHPPTTNNTTNTTSTAVMDGL